jgi:outer membrane receptor protein involved in Fe transport
VTQAAVYHRRGSAALAGSANDTPLFAEADRALVRTGALAAVTLQRGPHQLKIGGEAQSLSLDEDFGFFVTDEEAGEEAGLSDEALEHDEDDPFNFSGRARPSIWSFYLQDTWQAGAALTVAAGVRFDHSTLLLDRDQWSPRAGLAYRMGSATVARASVSRFYQPPQSENLLLSSSEEARELSPLEEEDIEGGAEVEPERQWAIEAGVEHRFGRFSVDGAYWRRGVREAADPNVFFGTTIVFPNAVAKGRAHGFDLRLDVPRARGWSGYGSVTIGSVIQTGPVTGGLFLEDEVAELGPGVEFVPDHDQRVALSTGVTWLHDRSNLTISVTGRYESGTPIQREDEDEDELAERPGAEMVDFDRGRVKPRTVVSVLAAIPILDTDRVRLDLRGTIGNVFDQRYAYNFGNPFSGTHFGAPRTAAVSLRAIVR